MSKRDIGPSEVACVLNAAGATYVLVGAHAANGYLARPRNTVDVVVIVADPKTAIEAISTAFTELTLHDTPVVARFKRADGEEAIDLIKPAGCLLWERLLKIAKIVVVEQVPINIPPVEGVLAAKFGAMTSHARRLLDKQQDEIDFARIVTVNDDIELVLLRELGGLVYPGGGNEIIKLAENARAGKRLEF